MELKTLNKANKVVSELKKWQDIDTRLSLGDGFFAIKFVAYEAKTLPNKYETHIADKETIETYKQFVTSMIKQCMDEFKNM